MFETLFPEFDLPFPSAASVSSKISEQTRLLSEAETTGEPLSKVLAKKGWSYDDLVYENTKPSSTYTAPPVTLDMLRRTAVDIPFISFFAGCGGMDLGFEAAGFAHGAAFEINDLFCKTLRRNRPSWKVFGPPTHSGDVSQFDEVSSVLAAQIASPFEGVFIGGPPCQPFSIAANQRFSKTGDDFKRIGFAHEKNGNLLFDYVDLIREFRPSAFVIENVPGLRDLDGGRQLSVAIRILQAAGYRVEIPFILDAAKYGVPQQRQRLFVIGNRMSRIFQKPSTSALLAGAGRALQNISSAATNHETREHRSESVLRYQRLNYGQRDQLGRVDRLDPDLPSKTVIAGGVNGGGRSHLHPEIPRTLSVRECARLQTFPDDYTFIGPTARQFTQVGNAVPPVLAAQIACCIRDSIFREQS